MFWFNWTVCLNVVVFSVLTVFIVILASGANLATVANTISIEKDWVVVIADGNVDTLASKWSRLLRLHIPGVEVGGTGCVLVGKGSELSNS